jgi:rod shape-determining protein MreC
MERKGMNNPWVHGVLAGVVGLLLFTVSLQLPLVRGAMDATARLLYWPEYPASTLRRHLLEMYLWISRETERQERFEQLEGEVLALRTVIRRLGVTEQQPASGMVTARVTLREPSRWWQEIRIDRGSRSGIRVGSPVLQNGFLIGRISQTSEEYAWVELITSSTLLIPAVLDRTRDLGVVTGDDAGRVLLLYIPEGKKIQEEMSVSTALVGEFLPPGIPIGKVAFAEEVTGGYRPYVLAVGGDLARLYSVSVMVREGAP